MGVSKVNYGNTTLVDLTGDSVSPENLMQGETAHNRDGEGIVGTAINVNNLSLSTNTPADADEIITKESSTWYRKAFSKVWDYTKSKIKSVLGINENTASDIFNVYGAKNLIPKQTSYLASSDGSIYIEPELNADGTIDFGEFSGGTYCNCELSLTLSLPRTGDYIFTSGLTDASDSTAYIEVYKTVNATAIKVYNEPVVIEGVNYIHKIRLVSKDGQSRTYKPMLRTIGIESNTYVPYAMTNKELTDKVITKEILHPIGTIIESTTCDTMAKVVAAYGGTTWIQHTGYVLRGASSGVVANSATKTGGADTHTLTGAESGLKSHGHGFTQPTVDGGATNTGWISANHVHGYTSITEGGGNTYGYFNGQSLKSIGYSATTGGVSENHYHPQAAHTHSVSGGAVSNVAASDASSAHNNLPNYKSVYIWERTA